MSVIHTEHLAPLDESNGFPVRPGFYDIYGATALGEGVNFTIHSHGATACTLLLYRRMETTPYASIPFPESCKIGFVYSMIVFGLDIESFEYAYQIDGPYQPEKGLLFDPTLPLLDPYAKAVTGQSVWGQKPNTDSHYRARVVRNNFDWGNTVQPLLPMEDMIIYELHVRGFTKDASSCTKYPGTFAGLMEKIPYLKELGINAVELMPIFEFDETHDIRVVDGKQLCDYWGYNTISFFAPNTSFTSGSEYNHEGRELKNLIRALHENKIEVILDVVFNHTAEGDHQGPHISFKGFDNNIYYMLTPDGTYYNFSGCGNTLNCNHPIVQQMILDCLRYWVTTYRIDGFRFDLASILGRNEDGSPMGSPPLLQSLAFDPILGKVKLIAEAWDAGGLYQVGTFPSWRRWSEWNGKYRDDIRSFLKGDYWFIRDAAKRITGSHDLYDPESRKNASVNFLTCHDGFSLYDLYSYNEKHNKENGWENTDGADDNRSWNCGVEGPTTDEQILKLRHKMIKNACAVLLCSRGIPMFLSGDEFGDTRFGNNNPYCQDNEISWLDWSLLDTNQDLYDFFRYMIHFRHEHKVLQRPLAPSKLGFPDTSLHQSEPWNDTFTENSKLLGTMFSGYNETSQVEDTIFLAVNVYWEAQVLKLPQLSHGYRWHIAVNTADDAATNHLFAKKEMPSIDHPLLLGARSVVVLVVKPI